MTGARLRDEVGVAMPLTLIALVILSGLMIAFAVLAESEPVIAANQYRGAVARALAESAVERAVWALTAGSGVSGGIGPPSNGVVAGPPHDGCTYITNRAGGFPRQRTGESVQEGRQAADGAAPGSQAQQRAPRAGTAAPPPS